MHVNKVTQDINATLQEGKDCTSANGIYILSHMVFVKSN